jgi:hypothetical protein
MRVGSKGACSGRERGGNKKVVEKSVVRSDSVQRGTSCLSNLIEGLDGVTRREIWVRGVGESE